MLHVSELFVYPIKSLGGMPVQSALVTDRGFQYDRRWMLIDGSRRFLSQREFAQMALLQVDISDGEMHITHKSSSNKISIPIDQVTEEELLVTIWDDECIAQTVSSRADEFFSDLLSFPCRLVYMPDSSHRFIDTRYAHNNEISPFSDDYPFLIIGQSSLDDLNNKLESPVPMDRFRPNIVFTGGAPFEEDVMAHFTINEIDFFGVKLCARCVITTIDQELATKSKEPLKTLARYRLQGSKVMFGQNLLHKGGGKIKVGDSINRR